jgi:hypothetical protein
MHMTGASLDHEEQPGLQALPPLIASDARCRDDLTLAA